MQRQEESNNHARLRQNENTNQEDSPMSFMNGARPEMKKKTMVENNQPVVLVGQDKSMSRVTFISDATFAKKVETMRHLKGLDGFSNFFVIDQDFVES
jgi:hypothetical protein